MNSSKQFFQVAGVSLSLMSLLALPSVADARSCSADSGPALTELSLEQLMQIEITSLGKKPESLSKAAAAVFVITNQDIRRSGATSIVDALRLAPGLHVSQINAHAWAVSARGFNGFFANKMLVLRDGRNVYSSTFGGVYWDTQDTLLEDIERIEVIRGPAGTIWGSNAVNGVINIISKCAKDTQGGYFTAGIGKENKTFIGYRYGGKLKNGHYRAYVKANDYDGFADTRNLGDRWRKVQAGFRGDVSLSAVTSLRLSGEFYRSRNEILNPLSRLSETGKISGANIMALWEHKTKGDGEIQFQTYLDQTRRQSDTVADISVTTLDFDFQHRFGWGAANEFNWGLGYRYTTDEIKDKPAIKFNPPEKSFSVITAFAQNQFGFFNDKLRLTIGSKFEHNDFTGTEVQPSIRAAWFPRENLSLWAAASHAVHTVSRAFTAVEATAATTPVTVQFVGDKNLGSEEADVLEIGLRGQASKSLNWDAAFFLAKYTKLLDTQRRFVATLPGFQISGKNDAKATTSGAELSINWQPTDTFRLQTSYTYLEIEADSKDDPGFNINLEGRAPRHQLSLRPSFDLSDNLDLDFWVRYVDDLEYTLDRGTTITQIDDYVGLDARLAWRPRKNIELSLSGQNLLKPEHVEFGPDGNNLHTTSVERNVYLQLRWNMK